jgi:hypothetical protein
MSFCCGAGMIGTSGTLKHGKTYIHHVPLLLCPVCHRVEVHYLAEEEYDILAEYANGDGAHDVDFKDYVDLNEIDGLYENCINQDDEDPDEVIRVQIDMALDLLSIAKHLNDEQWMEQLKKRLSTMSDRRNKLRKRRISGYRK